MSQLQFDILEEIARDLSQRGTHSIATVQSGSITATKRAIIRRLLKNSCNTHQDFMKLLKDINYEKEQNWE